MLHSTNPEQLASAKQSFSAYTQTAFNHMVSIFKLLENSLVPSLGLWICRPDTLHPHISRSNKLHRTVNAGTLRTFHPRNIALASQFLDLFGSNGGRGEKLGPATFAGCHSDSASLGNPAGSRCTSHATRERRHRKISLQFGTA